MSPRPRKISDKEILNVACDCFLEHGPGDSIQVIADRVGLSQPALFKRFHTKEELMLAALLPPDLSSLIEWLDSGPTQDDIYPQLKELIERLWTAVKNAVPRIAVLHLSGILSTPLHSRFKKIPYFIIIEAIAGWLHRAQQMGGVQPEGNPFLWAQSTMGTLQGRAYTRFILSSHMEAPGRKIYVTEDDDQEYIDTVFGELTLAVTHFIEVGLSDMGKLSNVIQTECRCTTFNGMSGAENCINRLGVNRIRIKLKQYLFQHFKVFSTLFVKHFTKLVHI